MNGEQLAQLAEQAMTGNKKAVEQLMLASHTPVAWLCGKLLPEAAARKQTREILKAIPKGMDFLEDPADFEKWLCKTTATRCMHAAAELPSAQSQPEKPKFPARTLNETQTAHAVVRLVDGLPREPRLCLLLYSCGMLSFTTIGQLLGCPKEAVLEHLHDAQKRLNNQMRAYHAQGVRFAPITSLPTLLRTAMYSGGDPKAAAAMVGGILGKNAPAAPKKKRKKKPDGLLIAVIAAAVLLILLVGLILFLELAR